MRRLFHKKRHWLQCLLLIAFCLFFSSSAFAADQDEVFRVVVNDAPPFRIIENAVDGVVYTGAYIDIIDEISRRADIRLQFIHVPFARALEMMKAGEADLMLGPNWSIDRASYMVYLKAQFPAESKIFCLNERVGDIDDYEGLTGLKIGVQRSSKYFAPFDEDTSLNKVEFNNYRSAFRALESGFIDAVIIPEKQGLYMMNESSWRFQVASFQVPGVPSFITISKLSTLLKKRKTLEKVMSQLQQEGFYEKLMVTYLE